MTAEKHPAKRAPDQHAVVGEKKLWTSLIAGGCAGAMSRTIVSPLERLKKEGFQGFMRGNGLNCLRIAPYSAVQFATYESVKKWLSHPVQHEYKTAQGDTQTYTQKELGTLGRLCAGAIAGFTSVVSTYPLDLVRSRISIASASMYMESGQSATVMDRVPGIMETACKVYTEEGGLRGLYRGCLPTSLGVAPYVAFNFVFYESARTMLTKDDGTPPGPIAKLCLGAWAGAVSQTLTYPLDVIRRRMQVSGMRDSKLGVQDKNAIDAIRNIVARSGFRGLYYGLLPNLLKVAPSTGAYFLTYEVVGSLLSPYAA
ncbi:hypothetical protein MEQU1_002305 [Malassezia equina]|uniref:Mitochondrial carrier protein n=1 Tax=Malassezia equina TaxID=1381935 RepID=A0AAF0EIY3_9BASI|nr:hypothetical protein MEQU1_002305 [Malassezia equina]